MANLLTFGKTGKMASAGSPGCDILLPPSLFSCSLSLLRREGIAMCIFRLKTVVLTCLGSGLTGPLGPPLQRLLLCQGAALLSHLWSLMRYTKLAGKQTKLKARKTGRALQTMGSCTSRD